MVDNQLIIIFLILLLVVWYVITELDCKNAGSEHFTNVELRENIENIRVWTHTAAKEIAENLSVIMDRFMNLENITQGERFTKIIEYPLYHDTTLKWPVFRMYRHFECINLNLFDKRKDNQNINEGYKNMIILISRGFSRIFSEELEILYQTYYYRKGGYDSEEFRDIMTRRLTFFIYQLVIKILSTQFSEHEEMELIANSKIEEIVNNSIMGEVDNNNHTKDFVNETNPAKKEMVNLPKADNLFMKKIKEANSITGLIDERHKLIEPKDRSTINVTDIRTLKADDAIRAITGISEFGFDPDLLESVPRDYHFECSDLDRENVRIFVDNKRVRCADKLSDLDVYD